MTQAEIERILIHTENTKGISTFNFKSFLRADQISFLQSKKTPSVKVKLRSNQSESLSCVIRF